MLRPPFGALGRRAHRRPARGVVLPRDDGRNGANSQQRACHRSHATPARRGVQPPYRACRVTRRGTHPSRGHARRRILQHHPRSAALVLVRFLGICLPECRRPACPPRSPKRMPASCVFWDCYWSTRSRPWPRVEVRKVCAMHATGFARRAKARPIRSSERARSSAYPPTRSAVASVSDARRLLAGAPAAGGVARVASVR